MKVAIYETPIKKVISVVYLVNPEEDLVSSFKRVIPKGIPFWIVDKENLPQDVPIELWEIDKTIPPDGYGENENLLRHFLEEESKD